MQDTATIGVTPMVVEVKIGFTEKSFSTNCARMCYMAGSYKAFKTGDFLDVLAHRLREDSDSSAREDVWRIGEAAAASSGLLEKPSLTGLKRLKEMVDPWEDMG